MKPALAGKLVGGLHDQKLVQRHVLPSRKVCEIFNTVA